MKKYLEFTSDKSSKFWEIERNGKSFTTCYGKMGSDGRTQTKSFENEEKAKKEYDKLLKQKLKKGYIDCTKPVELKIITSDESLHFVEKYESLWEKKAVLIEDDLHIDGDFVPWLKKHAPDIYMVIITGNLVVDGNLIVDEFDLLVQGNVFCDFLLSRDSHAVIVGNTTIKYALMGKYNDGSISIEGTTFVPFSFNDEHATSLFLSPNSIEIEWYNDYGDFDRDFLECLIPSLTEDIIDDEDEYEIIEVDDFVALLKAGKSPFKNVTVEEALNVNDKEQFIRKLRNTPKEALSFSIKNQGDVDAVLGMESVNELIFRKKVDIPSELIKKSSLEKIKIHTKLLKEKKMAKALGEFSQITELVFEGTFWEEELKWIK